METQQIIEAFKAQHPDAHQAIFDSGLTSNKTEMAVAIDAAKASAKAEGVAEEKARNVASGAVAFTSQDFIAAFGDKGARWFCEGKSFAASTTEYLASMKAEHEAALAASNAKVDAEKANTAAVQAKLDAMPRGNDAASFSAENPKGKVAADPKLVQKMGSEGMATFVASMNMPDGPSAVIPPKAN